MPEKSLVQLVPNLARCRYDGVPDDALVNRYTHEQDEDAFTELVRRHGPMVLSVCRRVLRNSADADDVFQATFMVLARKAGSIHPASSVGRWLHGVAFRTAKEARRRAARRRAKESRVAPREETSEAAPPDVRPVLDAELARLPKKFAEVLVLCDMEGRTRPEVATLLRVPEGTVASRLSRAREMLATRLTRRGFALTAGAVAAAVAPSANAAPSPELLAGTAKSALAFGAGRAAECTSPGALALANAVLRAGARLKFLAVGLVVVAVALTGWAATTGAPTQQQPPPSPPPSEQAPMVSNPPAKQPEPPPPPAPVPDPVAVMREKLAGQWQVNEGRRDDKPLTDWEKSGFQFDFNASGVVRVHRGQVREQRVFTWAVDPNAKPPALVLTPPDGNKADSFPVAFELRDGALILSWSEPDPGRGRREPPPRGGGGVWQLTLSKVTAPGTASDLTVASAPQNVIGSRLAGTWEPDAALNERLGGKSNATAITFAPDAAVAREVPEVYRELFANKRIYLAGRMTVTTAGAPVSYRFLLIEHLGNAMLVYFIPRKTDEWSCEEAATVMLLPGAEREKDLLFLTAFETAPHTPAGGYRRIAVRPHPQPLP